MTAPNDQALPKPYVPPRPKAGSRSSAARPVSQGSSRQMDGAFVGDDNTVSCEYFAFYIYVWVGTRSRRHFLTWTCSAQDSECGVGASSMSTCLVGSSNPCFRIRYWPFVTLAFSLHRNSPADNLLFIFTLYSAKRPLCCNVRWNGNVVRLSS